MMAFLSCARNHKFNRRKKRLWTRATTSMGGANGTRAPSGCSSSFKHATGPVSISMRV